MRKAKVLKTGLTSVLLCSVLLTACSDPKATESNTTESNTTAASATTKATEKPMKITMFQAGAFNPTAPFPAREEDPIRQMLEKAANVDLAITIPPGDQKAAKLNTMIASGETPDLIFMWDSNVAADYYNQGVTAELDSYLQDYPALLKRFSQDSWDAMKIQGKTIGTPGLEGVSGVRGWWMRNDWLQKLSLAAPTTPEELLNVMKEFTFKDPDGNGKNDTYGFVAGVGKDGELATMGWEQIFWMFGVLPHKVDITDGKLTFDNTDPRMKEALGFIQQMLEAKVVDPDWVSVNDFDAIGKKMYGGKVGFMVNDWRMMEPGVQDKMKEVGGSVPDWIVVPPAKGPHGDQWMGTKPYQANSWAISKNAAKDPDKVKHILSLLEYWYTNEEAYPYVAYGLKGIQWDMVDGKPKKKEYDKEVGEKYLWTSNWADPRRPDDAIYFNFLNPKTSEFQQINMKYVKKSPVGLQVTLDPNDTAYNDRKKFINESLLKFMIGKDSLTNWDAYVQTLDSKFENKKYMDEVTSQLKAKALIP